jgi:hypothetical protein
VLCIKEILKAAAKTREGTRIIFQPQTYTDGHRATLIKNFCGGSRGAVFSKSAPLATGGKKIDFFFAAVYNNNRYDTTKKVR